MLHVYSVYDLSVSSTPMLLGNILAVDYIDAMLAGANKYRMDVDFIDVVDNGPAFVIP